MHVELHMLFRFALNCISHRRTVKHVMNERRKRENPIKSFLRVFERHQLHWFSSNWTPYIRNDLFFVSSCIWASAIVVIIDSESVFFVVFWMEKVFHVNRREERDIERANTKKKRIVKTVDDVRSENREKKYDSLELQFRNGAWTSACVTMTTTIASNGIVYNVRLLVRTISNVIFFCTFRAFSRLNFFYNFFFPFLPFAAFILFPSHAISFALATAKINMRIFTMKTPTRRQAVLFGLCTFATSAARDRNKVRMSSKFCVYFDVENTCIQLFQYFELFVCANSFK